MKTAQPKIPKDTHDEMKKEAQKRGMLLIRLYQDVIDLGIKELRKRDK